MRVRSAPLQPQAQAPPVCGCMCARAWLWFGARGSGLAVEIGAHLRGRAGLPRHRASVRAGSLPGVEKTHA